MRFFKQVCWAWFVAASLSAQAAPTADEIIARVVAQDKKLVERRKAFDYNLDITREKLDAKRTVTETTRERLVVKGDHRPGYGTRSSAEDPEEEAQKTSREEPFELLKIIDHYTYTLEGEETADGIPCYKIAFIPQPDMPYENPEDKDLN